MKFDSIFHIVLRFYRIKSNPPHLGDQLIFAALILVLNEELSKSFD